MLSKSFLIALAIAYVEARFGQEQIPVAAIQALTDFGEPGAAGTLSGQVPGSLLAGASACDKLALADEIVAQLGTDPAVIAAAQALVGAEQNFNDFADATGRICNDATLPATAELQGILPLFDPAVAGADVQNANAALSLQTPFDAAGVSVAELSRAQGFENFNEQDAAGTVTETAVDAGAAGADAVDAADAGVDAAAADVSDAGADAAQECTVVEVDADDEEAADADAADVDAAADADAADADAADADAAADAGAADVDAAEAAEVDALQAQFDAVEVGADADFGNCDLTISRLPNTEFANRVNEDGLFFFQSNDAGIADGQQEALNGRIIINRVCDDLVNECGGNEAAQAACQGVQDLVDGSAIGNNSPALADAFNAGIAAIGAA